MRFQHPNYIKRYLQYQELQWIFYYQNKAEVLKESNIILINGQNIEYRPYATTLNCNVQAHFKEGFYILGVPRL